MERILSATARRSPDLDADSFSERFEFGSTAISHSGVTERR
ncbi:hypothetical protein [Nocardia fluminea]|nr:hypothetical protein [Nocardia fluminea]